MSNRYVTVEATWCGNELRGLDGDPATVWQYGGWVTTCVRYIGERECKTSDRGSAVRRICGAMLDCEEAVSVHNVTSHGSRVIPRTPLPSAAVTVGLPLPKASAAHRSVGLRVVSASRLYVPSSCPSLAATVQSV